MTGRRLIAVACPILHCFTSLKMPGHKTLRGDEVTLTSGAEIYYGDSIAPIRNLPLQFLFDFINVEAPLHW